VNEPPYDVAPRIFVGGTHLGSVVWYSKKLDASLDKERCVINGRDAYLLFFESIRNAKLSQQLNKLEVPVTVRNWKTMMKLATMSEE